MTKHIDQKFAKIVALMKSTEHEGEKRAARKRAEAVATSCGMTFDEAIKASSQPVAEAFVNIFDGFADYMERQEPGYKARRSAEQAERAQIRRDRLDALLVRYGTIEAITAPCEKELLLRKALAPWIVYCEPPDDRWTRHVDGYDDCFLMRDMPEHISAAVAAAYPIPTSIDEAKAEFNYWEDRIRDMEAAFDDDIGSELLDRPVIWRREMVRDLIEKDLRLTTIKDVVTRFAFYRELECHSQPIEDAIFRDLEAMAQAEADLSTVDLSSAAEKPGAKPKREDKESLNLKITDLLWSNMKASDRTIARSCGCSPTTVGKVRKKIGFFQITRSVQRGGQIYRMRPPQR